MGSWWEIEIGQQASPIFGKNFVPDDLMMVFTEADRFVDQSKREALAEFEQLIEADPEVEMDDEPPPWRSRLIGYSARADALRTRLKLQGFSSERVRKLSADFFDNELYLVTEEYPDTDLRDSWSEGHSRYPDGDAVTRALVTRRGKAAARARLRSEPNPEQRFLHAQWDTLRESFDDPRFILALSLMNTRAETKVVLELTDLVLGGYMQITDRPHEDARLRLSAEIAASGPVIVIAEGSSDARWLRRSLEIAMPAAAHLFEFLDFAEYRAPGGTDRVVSLTKGMASAGVMNRIVAVFDNDTAGRVAADQLRRISLPDRIATVTLPEVNYAKNYPTLGPQGASNVDVNGRASSIEFMFGDEVLRDTDGALFPVRWHSYIEHAGDYQGRLDATHKGIVGDRLDNLLTKRSADPLPDQVLDGCQRLASLLIGAAKPPNHMPASESSDLTSEWCKSQA